MTKFARRLCFTACLTGAVLALAACTKPGGAGADDGDGGGTVPATASEAASPAAAIADSPMTQKAGLWQLTHSLPNLPAYAVSTRMCVDESMGDKMVEAGMQKMPGDGKMDCQKKSVTAVPGGADVAMTCTSEGRTIDSHIHFEKISDVEFKQTSDVKFSPALPGGKGEITSTTTGKWLGACPSGMKGGDFEVGTNGVKTNMYDAMKQMKSKMAAPN